MAGSMKTKVPIRESITPVVAINVVSSFLLAPMAWESTALIPTLVPTETAIIKSCTGKAREVAVRASSESRATKMLSTML